LFDSLSYPFPIALQGFCSNTFPAESCDFLLEPAPQTVLVFPNLDLFKSACIMLHHCVCYYSNTDFCSNACSNTKWKHQSFLHYVELLVSSWFLFLFTLSGEVGAWQM